VGLLLWGTGVSASVAQKIPGEVRVKMMALSFPLKIQGADIVIRGLKRPSDISNVAIPRSAQIEINFRKIAGQKIWFVKKSDEDIRRISRNYLEIQSSDPEITISGYRVPTPVLISPRGDIISSIKFEDYLLGVIAGEMPIGWPLEALKAQAVAARSYTLYQIKVRQNAPYQLAGSVLDQAYSTDENPIQRDKIREALKETENLVLESHGRVVKAYYHSDCGGQTEDPSQVWKGEPSFGAQSVIDAQCGLSNHGKWSYEISLDDLNQKLEKSQKLDSLQQIKVMTRSPTGRATLIALNGSGEDLFISGNDLRQIVGFGKLKSTLFTLTQNKDKVIFSGKGFGHGSGLCQWGAQFMAKKGSLANEILHHYYPGAQISAISLAHAQD
jgi:stage II sporulation protein D